MNLKVNNCGECPFMYTTVFDLFVMDSCKHPEFIGGMLFDTNTIPTYCPLKTSPITIKLNEDESK